MKELGDALKALLDKLSDFFDIFDLSFFVSGAAAIAALAFWGLRAGITLPASTSPWVNVLVVILACYITGLLCFALGRWVRMQIMKLLGEKSSDEFLRTVVEAHVLQDEEPYKSYLADNAKGDPGRLYTRLWAEIRQSDRLAPSLSLVRRYWVMAATYDGLAFALVVWMVVLIAVTLGAGVAEDKRPSWWVTGPVVALLALAVAACLHEARRFMKYQVEDLVAALATDEMRKA